MKYTFRILAFVYVQFWTLWAVSIVGKQTDGAVTAEGASLFIIHLLTGVALGWLAHKEHEANK